MLAVKDIPLLILAGGLATRLKPLTETVPKALIPVGGRPFIDLILRWYAHQGVKKVYISIGHLGEMIKEVVGNGEKYQLEVHYIEDGKKLLGTGGAVVKASDIITENQFFLTYGDTFLPIDLAPLVKRFMQNPLHPLMTVFKNDGDFDQSNVEFDGENIINYSKSNQTKRMNYIDYGLFLIPRASLRNERRGVSIDFSTFMERWVEDMTLAAYEVKHRFYEIGSHQGKEELDKKLLSDEFKELSL